MYYIKYQRTSILRNAPTSAKFQEVMVEMQKKCPKMHTYLKDIEKWPIYPYVEKQIPLYGSKSSNPIEQCFSVLLEERALEGVSFCNAVLQMHFGSLMKQYNEIEKKKSSPQAMFTEYAEEYLLQLQLDFNNNSLTQFTCTLTDPVNRVYTVTRVDEKSSAKYEVTSVKDGTCTCDTPSQMQLPCVHMYCIVRLEFGPTWRTRLGTTDLPVSPMFGEGWKRERWKKLYTAG